MSYIHKHTYSHYTVEWKRVQVGDFLFARKRCSENIPPHVALSKHIDEVAKQNFIATQTFASQDFPFPFPADPMAGFVFGEVLRKWKNIIWVRDYFGNEVDIKPEDELIRVSQNVTKLTVK